MVFDKFTAGYATHANPLQAEIVKRLTAGGKMAIAVTSILDIGKVQ